MGRLSRGQIFQRLGHLPGVQGGRSRVSPLVGNQPGDFAKGLFPQECPRPDWRIAQGLWSWSPCAVVADFRDCGCALMEGAPQGVETGAVWLGDRGISPKGSFGSLEIELRAVTRWAVHGMTRSVTKDCCPILSAASSRKGWEWERLAAGLASHPSRGDTARRMGNESLWAWFPTLHAVILREGWGNESLWVTLVFRARLLGWRFGVLFAARGGERSTRIRFRRHRSLPLHNGENSTKASSRVSQIIRASGDFGACNGAFPCAFPLSEQRSRNSAAARTGALLVSSIFLKSFALRPE